MSTNQAQPGRIVNIIAGGAVASGSVNVVGNYIGVALNSAAASGDVYPLAVEGVFTLAKKTGETWADGNLTGGVPVVHVLAIPAGATTTAFVFVKKTRILMLQALKTASAGTAGGELTIKNGANAITNAATWDNTTADQSVVPFATIDDAFYEIAAGGTLNITASHATSSGILTIIGINVA